jgi:hypothetical protein
MRIRMVSALCAILALIYSPRPATAQFNPALPPMRQAFARKLPLPGNLSELQTGANSRSVGTDAELLSRLRSLLQRRGAEQRQEPGSIGMQSLFEAGRCAHMGIIQAPDVDSKMIKDVPKEFSSNMPTWPGLQSCSGDFLGTTVIPQAAPFVDPGQIPDIALKPGARFLPHRP